MKQEMLFKFKENRLNNNPIIKVTLQPQTKETPMNNPIISSAKLKAVAGLTEKDDLSQYLPASMAGNDELAQALRESYADDRKQAIKDAVLSIKAVVTSAEHCLVVEVNELRQIRSMERARLDNIKNLNRAIAYGRETSNYLPLAYLVTRSPEFHGYTVPADWTPKAEASVEAAKDVSQATTAVSSNAAES